MKHLFRLLIAPYLVLVLAISTIHAAPAPLPRPEAVRALSTSDLHGDWAGTWGDSECPTTLSAFGSYACTCCGSTWFGSWRLERGDVLVIEAARAEAPERRYVWAIAWKRDKKGLLGRSDLTGIAKRVDAEDRNAPVVKMWRKKR